MSIELPVATRHRRGRTETLLKVKTTTNILLADSEDSDQTGWMQSSLGAHVSKTTKCDQGRPRSACMSTQSDLSSLGALRVAMDPVLF